MQTVKVKAEGSYYNHNVRQNKAIDVQFKIPYSELTNYIQSIQMLNEDVKLAAKIGAEKPATLGTFMINSIKIDNDGEGTIKFNSQMDFVDANKINDLAVRNDEPLVILMKAQIDVEEEDEEGGHDKQEQEVEGE